MAVVSAPFSRQACRLHSIEFAAGTLSLQKDKITIRDAESNDAPELAVLTRELGYEDAHKFYESLGYERNGWRLVKQLPVSD
ncbi:MAG TPA: hypothetical protein VLQ29_05095 [Candidatus Dormibacteraeota bacterium]|nr:hypothetical protein [Candidatus Dormibacteraeota bacterium]